MGSENDHSGFSFNFKLPSEDLALRSVVINNGIPELIFDAALYVPTLTEEDVGIACRLACEGVRPEFFYIGIPDHHPFHGRQYKHYSPEWLKGTITGELLAEVDWSMKCLTISARSDEKKERFWSWQKTSKLEGLATGLDFPKEKPTGSVKMSCRSVKVQKSENEMVFLEEPELRIDNESSSTYTKYITSILDSVAYYDEPRFLKMRELIKLILAAEWLKEKGIRFSRPWMKKCSARQVQSQSIEVKSKGPDEDAVKEILLHLLKLLPANSHKEVMSAQLGPLSVDNVVETDITEEGIEVKVTTTVLPSQLPSPKVEKSTIIRLSVNNYDWLYSSLNPNIPIWFEIPGHSKEIVPKVESWSELFSQTVPWPHIWKFPHCEGAEMVSACGGVTTSSIPVTEAAPTVSQSSRAKQQDRHVNIASREVHVKAKRGSDRKTQKVTNKNAPKVHEVNLPPKDVTSNTQRTQVNRKQKAKQYHGIAYGWEDRSGGQREMYDEEGKLIAKQRSLRRHVEEYTKVNGKVRQSGHLGASISLTPQMGGEECVKVDQVQPRQATANQSDKGTKTTGIPNLQVLTSREDTAKEKDSEAKVSENDSACPSNPLQLSLPITEPPPAQPQLQAVRETDLFSPVSDDSGISLSCTRQNNVRAQTQENKMPTFSSKSDTSSDDSGQLSLPITEPPPAQPQLQAVRETDLFSPVSDDSGISLSCTRQNNVPAQTQENKMPTFSSKSDTSSDDSGQLSLPITEPPPAQPQLQAVRETDLFSPVSDDSGISLSCTRQNNVPAQTQENKMPTFSSKSDTSSDDSGQLSLPITEPPPAQPQLQAVRETDLFSPVSDDSGISLSCTRQNNVPAQTQENKMPTFSSKSDTSSDDSGQTSPHDSELDSDEMDTN